MALLWLEGFEHYGSSGPATPDIDRKWPTTNRTSNMTGIVTGRKGRAMNTNTTSNPYFQTPDLGSFGEIIYGFAFKYDLGFKDDQVISQTIENGGGLGLELNILQSNKIAVVRGSTILGISTTSLRNREWYYIEMKHTINDSTGAVDVRINGVTEISLTNQDTKVGSATTAEGVRFWGVSTLNNNYTFDDIYVCDDSGSANNDFLGSIHVDGILPNAAGDSTDFTPSAGDNYAAVDDDPQDDDTTYVEDSTSSNRDLYNYEAMSSVSTILGVMVNTTGRETDGTNFTLVTVVQSDTTVDTDAGTVLGTTSYTTVTWVIEQDPDTSSAWTESGINAAQFGVEVG